MDLGEKAPPITRGQANSLKSKATQVPTLQTCVFEPAEECTPHRLAVPFLQWKCSL